MIPIQILSNRNYRSLLIILHDSFTRGSQCGDDENNIRGSVNRFNNSRGSANRLVDI